jgi:GT2 family glycosyltransferase
VKISVLVTTYGRRDYLEKCFASLLAQQRLPDQVVVVMRDTDEETKEFVYAFTGSYDGTVEFTPAEVHDPGVLAANCVGLPLVSGEILCFLDDDARARPDWIATIEQRFADDEKVGGVGGRDLQHTTQGVEDEPASQVGRVRWYGRIIGNHHCRLAGVHVVETLKGCNMSFRRELVSGFDLNIIGNAHYYEMDLCFAVRQAGFKILFDGDLLVDHYVGAPRYLPGNKTLLDPKRYFFLHHNLVYVMLKNTRGIRRPVFLAYTVILDTAIGFLKLISGNPEGKPGIIKQIFKGKLAGFNSYQARRKTLPGASGRTAA